MTKRSNNKKSPPKGRVLSLFDDLEEKDAEAAPLSPVTRPAAAEPDWSDGRDELNLAEFPLTLLSDRPAPGVERLTFSDTVYDSGDGGRAVTRTLTVAPAAGLGLPTPSDGDVLLALVQLTRWKNGFTSRATDFSRYELVKLLRWPDSGASYERVEQSLNRWMGVTLFYDHAWWDRRQRAWVNEKFHVLDRVSLRTTAAGVSSFSWGEVPFNSFRSENLKRIDLKLYFDLELPSSRRLYRFLDKRFGVNPQVNFDLRVLACEHVGFSREYPNGELKRKFLPAVAELETVGYVETVPPDERFVSPHHGSWRAVFRRRQAPAPASELAAELVKRGVSPPVAADLVAEYPADLVQARIGVHDWLTAEKDRRVEKNPAGYLVASLKGNYSPPADYKAAEPKAPPKAPAAPPTPAPPPAPTPVEAYLATLSAEAREKLAAEALAADPAAAGTVARATSPLFRQAAVDRSLSAHVARLLSSLPQ